MLELRHLRTLAALRSAGYTEGKNWLTQKFPGADHSEVSWSVRVHIPLHFLLSNPASVPLPN